MADAPGEAEDGTHRHPRVRRKEPVTNRPPHPNRLHRSGSTRRADGPLGAELRRSRPNAAEPGFRPSRPTQPRRDPAPSGSAAGRAGPGGASPRAPRPGGSWGAAASGRVPLPARPEAAR